MTPKIAGCLALCAALAACDSGTQPERLDGAYALVSANDHPAPGRIYHDSTDAGEIEVWIDEGSLTLTGGSYRLSAYGRELYVANTGDTVAVYDFGGTNAGTFTVSSDSLLLMEPSDDDTLPFHVVREPGALIVEHAITLSGEWVAFRFERD